MRFPTADGMRDMELTWAELARDTEWVTARLREHGLAAGQRALLTASGFEGFWGHAVIGALRALKVTVRHRRGDGLGPPPHRGLPPRTRTRTR